MGRWEPSASSYRDLIAGATAGSDAIRPYPFFLAHPLDDGPEPLGEPADWQAEWKWDGLRAQLVRRGAAVLWSRGEEPIGESFPEIEEIGASLPDGTVLDGEIVAWDAGEPLPFSLLQRRIGRRMSMASWFPEVPVVLVAFDALEIGGRDQRRCPLRDRRAALERLVSGVGHRLLVLSPRLPFATWEELGEQHALARYRAAEGLMLKRINSPYGTGRARGDWWKWKTDPFTIDAVLVYAQLGTGRRASLFTDYTFAVRDGDELVPVAKAYAGLTDEEIRRVDRHVRRTTLDRRGPVHIVRPELVFELAFDGIQRSTRHKAGLALRFPRMTRWRTDKTPDEVDRLDRLRRLLESRDGGRAG